MIKPISILIISLSTVLSVQAQSRTGYQLLQTFHIQSAGGWDYLAIGPDNNKLYVSHGTQVNILNLATGDSVGVIPNTTGVHGIAFDKEHNRGFTSNGRLNNVTVFDLSSNAIVTQIATGENPDAILYEPFSKKIITCNGRSKDLSVIDPVENKVIATIPVGGKPETAVTDNKGHLFVNIEDKSEILDIDTRTFTVLSHWSIAPGEEPTGLVIDRQTNRLFAGCGNKYLVVVNSSNGKVIDKLPIGDGCDGVGFDESATTIFTSNGEGTLSVYREKSADRYELLGTVITKRGARTIAVDANTHLVYLPTADFEPQPESTSKARPKMIPGTFQVLVYGKQ